MSNKKPGDSCNFECAHLRTGTPIYKDDGTPFAYINYNCTLNSEGNLYYPNKPELYHNVGKSEFVNVFRELYGLIDNINGEVEKYTKVHDRCIYLEVGI